LTIGAGLRIADAVSLTTSIVAVGSDTVESTARAGARFTSQGLGNPVWGLAGIAYGATSGTAQVCGLGSAVQNMFAKTNSSRYASLGSPTAGLLNLEPADEAYAQTPWASRGRFEHFRVVCYSTTPTFPITFALRINATDTALTVATTPGTTKVFSVGGVASVAVGDLVSMRANAASWAAGSFWSGFVQVAFTPT
jgi:hypothetical protein